MTNKEKKPNHKSIGIFSMSSNVGSRYQHRVINSKKYLEDNGIEVNLGNLYNKSNGYTTGSALERANEFNTLLKDNKVLLSMIGGWNTISALEYIDYDLIKSNNTKVIGNSDSTSLLLAIYKKTNLIVYYGMSYLSAFYEEEYIREWNKDSLVNNVFSGTLIKDIKVPEKWTEELIDWKNEAIASKKMNDNKLISFNDGIVEGRLIGGNLCTMVSMYNSEYMPEIKDGDILFIEDSLETIGKCERHFMFLVNSKIMDKVSGVILGKCEHFDCEGSNKTYYSLFMEVTKTKVPVLAEYNCGHTLPNNILTIGSTIRLDTKNKVISYLD